MNPEPSRMGRNPFGKSKTPTAPSQPIAAEPTSSEAPASTQSTTIEFLLTEAPARAVLLGVRVLGFAKAVFSRKDPKTNQ